MPLISKPDKHSILAPARQQEERRGVVVHCAALGLNSTHLFIAQDGSPGTLCSFALGYVFFVCFFFVRVLMLREEDSEETWNPRAKV